MELLETLLSLAGLALYLLPTIVAALNNKRMTGWIFLVNVLLGWTVLGWIGAVVWAVMDTPAPTPPAATPIQPPAAASPPEQPAPAPASTPPSVEPASLPTVGERVRLSASHIVRVGPEMVSRSTGELRPGTEVSVLRTSGRWLWVRSDAGEEGWIELKS